MPKAEDAELRRAHPLLRTHRVVGRQTSQWAATTSVNWGHPEKSSGLELGDGAPSLVWDGAEGPQTTTCEMTEGNRGERAERTVRGSVPSPEKARNV